MATYSELFAVRTDSALRNRVTVACIVAAEAIRSEAPATTNHANRLLWAKAVFADPEREASRMLWALLAANSGATIAQITASTDAALQNNVNTAVNIFATGEVS